MAVCNLNDYSPGLLRRGNPDSTLSSRRDATFQGIYGLVWRGVVPAGGRSPQGGRGWRSSMRSVGSHPSARCQPLRGPQIPDCGGQHYEPEFAAAAIASCNWLEVNGLATTITPSGAPEIAAVSA